MKITADFIKLVQDLVTKYVTPVEATGELDAITLAALLSIPQLPAMWPDKRLLIGALQFFCMKAGINAGPIDGYWGPQTEYGYELIIVFLETGVVEEDWRTDWPINTEDELVKFYGPVGTNQTSINLPYTHVIAWAPEKKIKRYTCHEKVADSIVRVLTRVVDFYGTEEISRLNLDQWGGCLNVRKMRGGSKWSMHSWGVANDYDPVHNKLRWGRDRAAFANPSYDMWWRLWEEEGWTSLGRAKNYDWMHIQAVRLK